MLGTLARLRATYGSPERYVVERCGLTPDDVARIRAHLVVDAAAAEEEEGGGAPVDWESHAQLLV